MKPIKVMVNGIPGNVAVNIARHVLADKRFELIPWSLTGPDIQETTVTVESAGINLIRPEKRDEIIKDVIRAEGGFISIDFTHPSAVNANAEFYCRNALPFVMGTTGGDRKRLQETVKTSNIPALIAPNMAKQIVGLQAMMEYAADNFPGLFEGFNLEVRESHQHGKADTSGTARAMVKYFNKMGAPFTEDRIQKERNPEIQKTQWGIPAEHIGGHAWHTYSLTSEDKSVRFEFTHNINGRDIYSRGTLEAVIYLSRKSTEEAGGKVFTMIDLLKGI